MAPPLVKDPVYLQLHRALRDLIRGDQAAVGGRFLTEREIASRFGVSRATANKALSSLVAEGLLEFKKGVGTFVRFRPLDYDLQVLVSFTGKALAAGKQPSTRVLQFESFRAAAAPRQIVQMLGLAPADEVLYMERLRLADQAAVILERRYVPAHFCPGLAAADLEESLYDLWTERYGLAIMGADQTIRAVTIRGGDAELLGVRNGAAGLLVISTGYLCGKRPLWTEKTLYRGDAYEFRNRLGPIQTPRPAAGVLLDIPSAAAIADRENSTTINDPPSFRGEEPCTT